MAPVSVQGMASNSSDNIFGYLGVTSQEIIVSFRGLPFF
jgi:hypothetical protein